MLWRSKQRVNEPIGCRSGTDKYLNGWFHGGLLRVCWHCLAVQCLLRLTAGTFCVCQLAVGCCVPQNRAGRQRIQRTLSRAFSSNSSSSSKLAALQ